VLTVCSSVVRILMTLLPVRPSRRWGASRISGKRPAGAAVALGRAVRGQGHGAERSNRWAALKIAVRQIGPALVFERLWDETGCRAVIAELAG
jgi:hypothetical protein